LLTSAKIAKLLKIRKTGEGRGEKERGCAPFDKGVEQDTGIGEAF